MTSKQLRGNCVLEPMEALAIVRRAANMFCKTSLPSDWKITLDDLVNEGILIYYQCCEGYDPTKAQFSTYLWVAVMNRFRRLIRDEQRYITEQDFELQDGLDTGREETPNTVRNPWVDRLYTFGYTTYLEYMPTPHESILFLGSENPLSKATEMFLELCVNPPDAFLEWWREKGMRSRFRVALCQWLRLGYKQRCRIFREVNQLRDEESPLLV